MAFMALSMTFPQTQENTCVGVFFKKFAGLSAPNFIKKRLQHVFSCEYCKMFKSSFFYRTPPVAALQSSLNTNMIIKYVKLKQFNCGNRNCETLTQKDQRTTFTKNVFPVPVKTSQSSCFQMILRKVILRNYNLLKVINQW